jgi:hypothetical protein
MSVSVLRTQYGVLAVAVDGTPISKRRAAPDTILGRRACRATVARSGAHFFVGVVVAAVIMLASPSGAQYSEPSVRVAMWYPERQVMPMSLDERSAGESWCGAVDDSLQAASVTAAVAASSRRIRIGYLGGLGQQLRRETAAGIGSGVRQIGPAARPVPVLSGHNCLQWGPIHTCRCHPSTCVFASMLSS